MSRSSYNKGRKVENGVHKCIYKNHLKSREGQPSNTN